MISPFIILDLDNESTFIDSLRLQDNEINKHPDFWGSLRTSDEPASNDGSLHTFFPINSNSENRKESYEYISSISDKLYAILLEKNKRIRNIQNTDRTDVTIAQQDCTIFIKSEITNPILTSIIELLLSNRRVFHRDANSIASIQIILTSNSSNTDELYGKRKAASLIELESISREGLIFPTDYIWLVSDLNHDGSYFDYNQINDSVSLFLDHMFNIPPSHYVKQQIDGVPCLFSSFGAASISFDTVKAERYLSLITKQSEFKYLIDITDQRFLRDFLSDELKVFFRKDFPNSKNDWHTIDEEIGQNTDNKNIYHDLPFDNTTIETKETNNINHLFKINHWKLINPFRNYIKIQDKASSDILSINFLSNLKSSEQDFVENQVESQFSNELNKSRSRVLETLKSQYNNIIHLFLDDQFRTPSNYKGLNYAISFSSLLNNNKELIVEYLRDDTSAYFTSIETIKDKVFDKILSENSRDTIKETEEKLGKSDLEFNEQMDQIEELKKDIIEANQLINDLLEKNNNEESSKVLQLRNKVSLKEESIQTYEEDIIFNKKLIKDLSMQILKIREDFNDISFKNQLEDETQEKYERSVRLITNRYLESLENNSEDLIERVISEEEIKENIDNQESIESIDEAISSQSNTLLDTIYSFIRKIFFRGEVKSKEEEIKEIDDNQESIKEVKAAKEEEIKVNSHTLGSIELIDTEISTQYDKINKYINLRNKILKWQILFIPLIVVLLMTSIMLSNFGRIFRGFLDFLPMINSWDIIKVNLIIILTPTIVALIHGFIKLRFNNTYILNSYRKVSDLINSKHNDYLSLSRLVNKKYKDEFIYKTREIAQAIIDDFREYISLSYNSLRSFKEHLDEYSNNLSRNTSSFELTTSRFDKALFEKEQIQTFYDSLANKRIFENNMNEADNLKISDLFLSFNNINIEPTNSNILDQKVKGHLSGVLDIFNNSVRGVSVLDIIFGRSLTDFYKNPEPPADIFKSLYNNSRPLLQSDYSKTMKGVPFVLNKIIGDVDGCEDIINSHTTNWEKVYDSNKRRLTFLSIKGNIPSKFLQDVQLSDDNLRDFITISEDSKKMTDTFFIKRKYYNTNIFSKSDPSTKNTEIKESEIKKILALISLEKIVYSEEGFRFNDSWISDSFNELINYYRGNADLQNEYRRLEKILDQSNKKKEVYLNKALQYFDQKQVKFINEEYHNLILDMCEEVFNMDSSGKQYDLLKQKLEL